MVGLRVVGLALVVVAGGARAEVKALISADDYPAEAMKRHEEGTVRVKLKVGADGRVVGCSIIQSATPALDVATCRVLTARARFTPAKDQFGKPIEDEFVAPPIRWVLPAPLPVPPPTKRKHDERGIR